MNLEGNQGKKSTQTSFTKNDPSPNNCPITVSQIPNEDENCQDPFQELICTLIRGLILDVVSLYLYPVQ